MKRNSIIAAAALLSAFLAAPAFASTKAAYMHYLKALMLQHQGDYAGALKEYDAASTLDPESGYILEQAAELALETGQADQALSMARRLIQIDPKSPKAQVLLGNVHWARGELREAQASFETALKLDPTYSDAMFSLGNLLNAQSPDKAKKYFEQYLATNPEHAAEAHFQIALVDERAGNLPSAVDHLKQAADIEPDFLQAKYTLAHLYEVQHDTDAALGIYTSLLDSDQDNLTLLNHIGEIYFLKNDPNTAEGYFLRAKAASPHNPGACLWLAILAEENKDFNKAANALADSSALNEEPELALRLSYYLTQAGRLKEAVAELETAHAKWPENNEIAYFLSLGYDDLKEPERGIVPLQELLKRSPDARDARYQLATLYEKMNKIDDMEREFHALLDQHPDDASALNYLGYSLTDRGLKLQEAEGYIRKAIELDPTNGAYLDSLGWSFFKQGRLPEAADEMKKALQQTPDDPAVLEHFGDVQKAQGDAAGAWFTWKTALAYDPGNQKLLKKEADVQAAMTPEELGGRLLEFMEHFQGGIEKLGSVCEVSGTIFGKPFSFNGLLTYEAPGHLRLELLGPLFMPVFRADLKADGSLTMDDLPIQGLRPEAVRQAILDSLQLLRDYFDARMFEERPAQYHKGWRTRWISTASRQYFMDDAEQKLQGVKTSDESALRLSLDEFDTDGGHYLPEFLKIDGKGFSIGIRMSSPNVHYKGEEASAPVPAPVSDQTPPAAKQ